MVTKMTAHIFTMRDGLGEAKCKGRWFLPVTLHHRVSHRYYQTNSNGHFASEIHSALKFL